MGSGQGPCPAAELPDRTAGLVTAKQGACVLPSSRRASHIWSPSAWNQLFGDACQEMPGIRENSPH